MLALEFGTGQVLWSILWLFLFIAWFWLIIVIFTDIMRSDDLSGWGKALWALLIIFFFYIGVFAYLIVRGGGMSDRAAKAAQAQDSAMRSYIQDATTGVSPAEQVEKLAQLHNEGKLTDEEFAAAKAKVLG
jgi:predicted membrane channel-forming protein YqfA (hemolysin III family)